MRLKTSNKLLVLSFIATILLNTPVIAAPKIIFKDSHTSHKISASYKAPATLSSVLQDVQIKYPHLHEIVVYKFSDHYVLYLLSSKVWGVTKIRVDLDAAGKVMHLIDPYQGPATLAANAEPHPICPDNNVQFVAISAYPNVGAVNESIALISEAAKKKYKTITILDENADALTYLNWMSCPNLKGFYSIGHGFPEGMVVGNGELVAFDYFNQAQFTNVFKNTTVVINSCQVYNFPFGTQIMYGNVIEASEYAKNPGPNAYEYLGGHTNLQMYSSELSSACFMAKAIEGAKMDYDTLKQCIGDQDLHYQNFGISQPGRYFSNN